MNPTNKLVPKIELSTIGCRNTLPEPTPDQLKRHPALAKALEDKGTIKWDDYDDSGGDTPWDNWSESTD